MYYFVQHPIVNWYASTLSLITS